MKVIRDGEQLRWQYTGDESAALNARHFSRVKAHKCTAECIKGGCDLFERKPLWEIMGIEESVWRTEHDQKWAAALNSEI